MSTTQRPVFSGVGVALATLYDDGLAVDYGATAAHARRLVDAGVEAVIVCGTTAEPETLSDVERLDLLDAVVDSVGGDVPVVMGASLPSGMQAGDFASQVVQRGVSAVLARSPRGVDDPTDFYHRVAGAIGETPLLAYHFPSVAPPGIPLDVLPDLPVVGVKDSSGNAERLLATLDAFGGDLYTGAAPLLLLAGHLGCTGAILALANAAPEVCIEAFAGEAKAQRALMPDHLRSAGTFPRGLKALMHERYGTSPAYRLR